MKYTRVFGFAFGFTLLVAGFFYRTILYDKLPVPADTLVGLYHPWRDLYAEDYPRGIPFKNFLITDPVRQQIPWKKIVIDAWKSGERPGWNPYTFGGVPLDANVQAAPFYPLNILFLVFDFASAWAMLIMLQPLLAGIFFYLYMRRLNLSVGPAMAGAISWAFGGFAVSWLTWGTIMHTALWLPLLLLCIEGLLRVKKNRYPFGWSVGLSVSAIMMIFGGHIQVALYGLTLAVLYFVWRAKKVRRTSVAGWVIVAFGGAALVSAFGWLPFLRFLVSSGRVADAESWKAAGWFLPWQHLAQFFVPDYFGNPSTLNYWGVWNYGELVGYVGVVPLILALSALGIAGIPRFFVLSIVISLFFMLPHPMSKLPFLLHIPVFSVLQPTRLMVIVDFGFSVLAAFGLEHLVRKRRGGNVGRMIGAYGGVLMMLWSIAAISRYAGHDAAAVSNFSVTLRNLVIPALIYIGFAIWFFLFRNASSHRLRMVWIAGFVVIIVFDLFRFGWKFTPFTPREYFFPETALTRFLTSQPKPFRVMSLDDRILPPNTGAYYGIETIEGYDPIAPKLYEDFLVASERSRADVTAPTGFNRIYTAHNIDSPLFPYFNVRYILSLADIQRPHLREVMREGETRVYEYTGALPRAYLSEKVVVTPKQKDALSALFADASSCLGVVSSEASIVNLPLSADETVRIVAYRPDELRLVVSAKSRRLLVILNRFDDRWTGSIDGKTQPIIRANYLWMGMVVPAGTHDVILSCR